MAWSAELLKLSVPFAVSQILYWLVWYYPNDQPSLEALAVKVIPVSSIITYILWHPSGRANAFTNRILAGMFFSVLGDAFLVDHTYFIHGVVAFAVAQVFYVYAFGWDKLKLNLGFGMLINS